MSSIRILLSHYRNFPTKSRKMLVCNNIFGCDLTMLDANPIWWIMDVDGGGHIARRILIC